MRQDKDRSGKWLLNRYGDAVLHLAGITGFTAWKHVPSELVAPRRLLDGLIEIRYPDRPTPTLVLVEIEAYSDADADRQVFDDLVLVALEKRVVPEVVSLVLKPRGNVRVTGAHERTSGSGRVRFGGTWPVVQLWEVDAERLLADPDVGVIPWVPFTRTALTPEELVARCVERIEAVPNDTERAGLLAVTELLAGFAFPGAGILHLFRGKPMIIAEALEAGWLREVKEDLKRRYAGEEMRGGILEVLQDRFGPLPADVGSSLETVTDLGRLRLLYRLAATCPDLAVFTAELSRPPA